MKPSNEVISAQFIIDKTGVILDIKTFEKLIDELDNFYLSTLAQAALKESTETVSHDEVKQRFAQKKSKK